MDYDISTYGEYKYISMDYESWYTDVMANITMVYRLYTVYIYIYISIVNGY